MSDLKEFDVGMTEYLTTQKGLGGIIKLRIEDFVVNEITQAKEKVHLTDLSTVLNSMKESQQELCSDDSEEILSLEDQKLLQKLANDDNKSAEAEPVLLKACIDKSRRTEIHNAIRKRFPLLESSTIDDKETGEKLIKVTRIQGNKRRRSRYPKSKIWRFVLYKKNIGTADAISLLCKKLHLKNAKAFHYAGTKDKRGITVQEVTTSLAPERLRNVNSVMKNIQIGNITPATKQLQLGDLSGNHFSITLRDVEESDKSEIEKMMRSFSSCGFINYFGMQRFGTSTVPTYVVGKALLASHWSEAVTLILSSVDAVRGSNEDVKRLLASWQTDGNAEEALKVLKNDTSCVGQLLHGLKKHGTQQLVQALDTISRNTRTLYVHSYQSYVWNRIVSRRITEFKTVPVVGDLVLDNEESDARDHCGSSEDTSQDEPRCKLAKSNEGGKQVISNGCGQRRRPSVKLLTEENISCYDITDIVMPLPGYDVCYPTYATTWYKQLFEEDGVKMEDLNHSVKTYSLSGTYRKMITHPKNLSWKLLQYNDYKIPLIASDLDRMNGLEVSEGVPDGKFYALRLNFDLETSSYATVALREIMKSDTSQARQTKLGNEHVSVVDASLRTHTT